MFSKILASFIALSSVASALPAIDRRAGDPVDSGPISGPFLPTGTGPGQCTSEYRLAGIKQVVFAYNLVPAGQSAEAFQRVPFADDCQTFINPNGGPAIPVAVDRTTTYDFALSTRQIFSRVTGQYTDYANGTSIIHTNVTLGALHSVAVPLTFYADVVFDYNDSCLIEKVQAFATIPTQVAGVQIQPPIIDEILLASDLYDESSLPINKRDLIPALDALDTDFSSMGS